MNALILKLAPTAVVIGVGGFLAWPYVGPDAPHWDSAAFAASSSPTVKSKPAAAEKSSAGGTAAKGASSEIPFSLLNPKLAPNPPRDPFSDPEAVRAAARKKVSDAVAQYLGDWIKSPGKRNATTALRNSPGTKGKGAGGRGGARSAAAAADPLSGLTLNATYILGRKAAAVINGTSYTPGQAIRLESVATGPPLLLAEVRPHSVLLSQGGRRLELKYASLRSETSARLSEASANGKPAAKGRAGAKPAVDKKAKAYDPFET
jgi:hypothetical protein